MQHMSESSVLTYAEDFIIKHKRDKAVVINDMRASSFYYEGVVKDTLLARMDSYRQAICLLLHYIYKESNLIPTKIAVIQTALIDYFSHLHTKIRDGEEEIALRTEIDKLVNLIRSKCELMNVGGDIKDFKTALNRAEHLVNWLRPIKPIITITKSTISDDCLIIQYDFPVASDLTEQNEYLSNPAKSSQWYISESLKGWEKLFWEDVQIRLKSDQPTLFTQPSTIRAYPGVPFYMRHGFSIVKQEKQRLKILYEGCRSRCSLISPNPSKLTRKSAVAIAKMNLEQIIKDATSPVPLQFIYYQTLLTPALGVAEDALLDCVNEAFSQTRVKPLLIRRNHIINTLAPNTRAGKVSKEVSRAVTGDTRDDITIIVSIIGKGFPSIQDELNIFFYKQNPDKDTLRKLFQKIENNITNETNENERYRWIYLHNFISLHYQVHIKSNKSIPAIHFAAAEACLMASIKSGYSFHSCKSGKDRDGMLMIMIDSQMSYTYHTKSPLLQFNCGENPTLPDNYRLFYRTLLESGHQRIMASTNAQGAAGLKCLKEMIGVELELDKSFAFFDDFSSDEDYSDDASFSIISKSRRKEEEKANLFTANSNRGHVSSSSFHPHKRASSLPPKPKTAVDFKKVRGTPSMYYHIDGTKTERSAKQPKCITERVSFEPVIKEFKLSTSQVSSLPPPAQETAPKLVSSPKTSSNPDKAKLDEFKSKLILGDCHDKDIFEFLTQADVSYLTKTPLESGLTIIDYLEASIQRRRLDNILIHVFHMNLDQIKLEQSHPDQRVFSKAPAVSL